MRAIQTIIASCILIFVSKECFDETSTSAQAAPATTTSSKTKTTSVSKTSFFQPLASALFHRVLEISFEAGEKLPKQERKIEMQKITQALQSLSASQTTLKRLDGMAHEAYQRTHSNSISDDEDDERHESATKVSGRITRNAGRAGCVADSLLACELCELIDSDNSEYNESDESWDLYGVNETLYRRKILFNETILNEQDGILKTLSVLILYEPDYDGGSGLDHGGIDDILQSHSEEKKDRKNRGRILIMISDPLSENLTKTLRYLDSSPYPIALSAGLIANEVASVHKGLYKAAGKVLDAIKPIVTDTHDAVNPEDAANKLSNVASSKDDDEVENEVDSKVLSSKSIAIKKENKPAIHIVGRSLAGGVASLMAAILDGTLPMPETQKKSKTRNKSRRRKRDKSNSSFVNIDVPDAEIASSNLTNTNDTNASISLSGYAQGRTSAIALGSPPCLSSNIKASYITSVIHGDDIISRTTQESLNRLTDRTKKAIKGGFLGQKVGWMADTVSLTINSMKSHAHGSEGEEIRLSIPGKVYLIRPRRLSNASSLHEVGGVSGREAIRAAVLWQLGDVLLSRSLWSHHSLNGYIHGLDRVQLREFRSMSTDDDEEEKYH